MRLKNDETRTRIDRTSAPAYIRAIRRSLNGLLESLFSVFCGNTGLILRVRFVKSRCDRISMSRAPASVSRHSSSAVRTTVTPGWTPAAVGAEAGARAAPELVEACTSVCVAWLTAGVPPAVASPVPNAEFCEGPATGGACAAEL